MSSSTKERSSWSGKWAFILAGAASAVGLGNMWRFPYLAAKYGGGTFILTYLILVFTFGVTLLLLECALGRRTGLSAIGAFRHFGKKFAFIGVLASAVPFIIAPYYSIIGGWVTKYTFAYLMNGPAALADGGKFFTNFISSPVESFVWMAVFMIVVFIIVGLGVDGGIERANLVMMPALIVMAVALVVYIVSMPGAMSGVAYYLMPDVAKFSPELFVSALGQMFYSLSLAMGIMITYGSYLDKKSSLPHSVANIGMFDLGVSILAGLMIVPAAFVAMGSGEAVAAKSGPSLMFITLPKVFVSMGPQVATVIGFLFFLLVAFAAITSAMSLVETMTSIIMDGKGYSRKKAFTITCVFTFVMGIFINLGFNGLSFFQPLGKGSTILDLFDFVSNSVLMPIVAVLTLVFVGWIVKPKTLIEEIEVSAPFKLQAAWSVMVKYIAPVLVIVIMVAYVGAQFGVFKF